MKERYTSLYLVPTPIGNLKDITFRAIEVLKNVDLILAEDTRTSGKLLKYYEISTQMQSHHMHNEHKTVDGVIQKLKNGMSIALISDAGTPAISDPGFLLTRACISLLNKSDDARIIFTSSSVGHQGRAYWGAYGISKAGQDNLMQILADELENNTSIRVNSIDPGRVRTRMRALAYPGEDPNTVPVPEEIMPTYLYLMGPDSKNITGKIFQV